MGVGQKQHVTFSLKVNHWYVVILTSVPSSGTGTSAHMWGGGGGGGWESEFRHHALSQSPALKVSAQTD